MKQEQKELLLRDLCGRLPYGVKAFYYGADEECETWDEVEGITLDEDFGGYVDIGQYSLPIERIKPYLFPLSSMTEEQAKELSILYGIKDILSIKITDEYIDFEVDDGFGSVETRTIWYDEMISSIEIFDWLNKNHFDYRGLIDNSLALDATGLNIY